MSPMQLSTALPCLLDFSCRPDIVLLVQSHHCAIIRNPSFPFKLASVYHFSIMPVVTRLRSSLFFDEYPYDNDCWIVFQWEGEDQYFYGNHSVPGQLTKTLRTKDGHHVKRVTIPNTSDAEAGKKVEAAMELFVSKYGSNDRDLVVFVYDGHGGFSNKPPSEGSTPLDLNLDKALKDSPAFVRFDTFWQYLRRSACDVLVVLSCCNAASALHTTWESYVRRAAIGLMAEEAMVSHLPSAFASAELLASSSE